MTDVYNPNCLEGLVETHYDIPNIRVDFKLLHVPVPTSVLRTTGYGPNIFASESFVDELASNKGIDPYHFRRDLLAKSPRSLAVLDLAADKSNWNTPRRRAIIAESPTPKRSRRISLTWLNFRFRKTAR